ncbi:MAG: hypothetical protein PVI86_10585 [Phycisphaerae bacterium]|jgi:hypothetical protein
MKIVRHALGTLRSAVPAILTGLVLFTGCTFGPPDNRQDTTGEDDGATITQSASPGTLLTIQEDEGLGSTTVYGSVSLVTGEPRVTSFSVDAGDETIEVSVDAEDRPTEITLGSTTLTMQYLADGSFDYQLYHLGVLIAEGNSFDSPSQKRRSQSAKWTPVTEIDVIQCIADLMNQWAYSTIRRHQPAYTGTADAHPFTDCFKNSNALWDLALTSCVLTRALQRRLNDAIARRGEEGAPSIVSTLIIILAVVPFAEAGFENASARLGDELWADPACRGLDEDTPGCTDTCQFAFDGTCDDGGPGSSYSLCELGTDCSDCGPRGEGDTGSSAECGDGICDGPAGEMTSCPEDCPNECGDDICNLTAGEKQSCPQDCPEVDCCAQTNGCPSEGLYDCPGTCCCCAYGARCVLSGGAWVCGI